METKGKRNWVAFFVAIGLIFSGLLVLHAALLDLDAFVTYSILDENGNPLPDGALVQIIGSSNALATPTVNYAGDGTSIIPGFVQPDDQILGTVRIGDNNSSNGTFTTTLKYDPDTVNYVYIRYFNYTNPGLPTGLVWWGTSAIFSLVPTLGVSRVDFAPNDNIEVQQINNFVTIPEPGTANLMLLFLGVVGGIRARVKRQRQLKPDEDSVA